MNSVCVVMSPVGKRSNPLQAAKSNVIDYSG